MSASRATEIVSSNFLVTNNYDTGTCYKQPNLCTVKTKTTRQVQLFRIAILRRHKQNFQVSTPQR
ncbi:hypothetical protein HKD37_19G052942 [Glycine soja]